MTSFDYILISLVAMTIVSVLNFRLARAGFQDGDSTSGWISTVLSAIGAAGALFNLTQLASM